MRRTTVEIIFDIANHVMLIFLAFITFYPFYMVILYSISDPVKVVNGIGLLLPNGFSLINYHEIFTKNDILHPAFVSLARTIIGTSLTVLCCAMFAYSLTKKELPFRRVMYRGLILTMYISAGLIPAYVTITALHLKNTFLVYILPNIIVAFYLVLIKTYMEQLPLELEESAMMDGANYFTIFFHIIIPLSVPVLVSVAIFQAVGHWNAWVDNLYYNSDKKLLTLQMVLLDFIRTKQFSMKEAALLGPEKIQVTPQSIRMAITVIVFFPIFLVYPFMQRFFIKGIMIGAIKG